MKINNRYQHFFWVLCILFIAVLLGRYLFQSEILLTHDSRLSLVKLICMKKAWLEGQIFPRWSEDMVLGYGYPVFNFYQPFFIQLATLLTFFIKNPILCINLASFAVYFASGLSMYLFVASMWGAPAGFLSAVAYLCFPYHIVDLYIRGAYSELTAFVFLPLLLWSLMKLAQEQRRRYMLALSVSAALLSITHNITNMLFIPWFMVFGVFLLARVALEKARFMIRAVLGFSLGIGITAFFWLPAIVEKKYVMIEKLYTGQYDFRNYFISLKELLDFVWNYKGPGIDTIDGVMVYELGIVHLLFVFAGVFVGFSQRAVKDRLVLIFFLMLAVFSIWMTTPGSLFVWERLPALKFVQFPWRYLIFTALSFSVLIGALALALKGRRQVVLVLCAACILVAVNLTYARPTGMRKVNLINNTLNVRTMPPNETGEFLPRGFKKLLLPPAVNAADIRNGDGKITAHQKQSSLSHYFTISAKTPLLVSFNSFYFPGWQVVDNGRPLKIIQGNPYGIILFELPEGEHQVHVFFGTTPVRILGSILSVLSFFALILMLFYKGLWISKKKQSS